MSRVKQIGELVTLAAQTQDTSGLARIADESSSVSEAPGPKARQNLCRGPSGPGTVQIPLDQARRAGTNLCEVPGSTCQQQLLYPYTYP